MDNNLIIKKIGKEFKGQEYYRYLYSLEFTEEDKLNFKVTSNFNFLKKLSFFRI
jgi:hypothetical protein